MHPLSKLTVPKGSVGIHWFEQNAYALVDSKGTIVLVDPYFPTERSMERFIRPKPPVVEAELPTSCVLLTHAHGDHTNTETVSRIRAAWPECVYVGPVESIDQIVSEAGVDAAYTRVIVAGGSVAVGDMRVYASYAKPPQGDPEAGITGPRVAHLSLVIEIEGHRIYVTGDAINNLADHDELLGPVAALRPDIGFLTTHPTEGEFPYFEGIVRIAKKVGLTTAVPSHYACFAKRTYDPNELAALLKEADVEPLIIPWNSHVVYS